MKQYCQLVNVCIARQFNIPYSEIFLQSLFTFVLQLVFMKVIFSDQEIIRMIENGDERALAYLYRTYSKMVRGYILKNSGKEEDIDDMLQDIVVLVWEKIACKEFVLYESTQLSTYIYSVMKNLWLKRLNKQSKFTSHSIEEHDTPDEDEENYEDTQKSEIVAQAMQHIGSTCKEILTYFYFYKYSMEEIAEKLNFANAQTVKAKKYQCQKKLEEIIKQQYNALDLL